MAPSPAASRRASWHAAALLDGVLLALFMVSAGTFGTLLEWSGSPLREAMPSPLLRRALMGLLMGVTAVALIVSPMGQRSGAHMNPATTLAFARLGRVAWPVAVGYVAAQFAFGALGLLVPHLLLGEGLASPEVHFVATLPGASGIAVAFLAELAMAFVLLSVVLRVGQDRTLHRYTPLCAGGLVALFILLEAPLSGMSINPARTIASGVWAGDFRGLWIYLAAPVLGMVLAAEWFARRRGVASVRCAKLHHENAKACTFRCGWE